MRRGLFALQVANGFIVELAQRIQCFIGASGCRIERAELVDVIDGPALAKALVTIGGVVILRIGRKYAGGLVPFGARVGWGEQIEVVVEIVWTQIFQRCPENAAISGAAVVLQIPQYRDSQIIGIDLELPHRLVLATRVAKAQSAPFFGFRVVLHQTVGGGV